MKSPENIRAIEAQAYSNLLIRARSWVRANGLILSEWAIILIVAFFYAGADLLNFDATRLQQTGEHNESATLPILAEVSVWRYGEIPLWNPYMLTGYPLAGDFVNHFWNPVSTLAVLAFGGINGMKVSVFISFILAGIGQWSFARIFGLRGMVRLWAAILFMLSGGIAMFWRVGWYELLLGVVWFPWFFAALWWSLARRDRASLALTALCVAMVLTTGGGYYPFYLSASASVLVVASLWTGNANERWIRLRRAVLIALMSAGLVAVAYLPLINGAIYTRREAPPDREQKSSQPIHYALMNYAVSQPDWFRDETLGGLTGYNWFYIGALPLVALVLVPLALRDRKDRSAILVLLALTLFLLLWHSNKYSVFKYIYDWIPYLYTLRFPNRLLIVASSPLIVLSGLGITYLYEAAQAWARGYSFAFSIEKTEARTRALSAPRVVTAILVLVLGLSLADVFAANKTFAFAPPDRLDAKSFSALSWLKSNDPELYYTNIGGGAIYWWWTPAAYTLEMPIINFQYNRYLASQTIQRAPSSRFFAKPKYMLARADQPQPNGAQLVRDFDGVGLWELPDALPFAFGLRSAQLLANTPLTPREVSVLPVRLGGPNRVIVNGSSTQDDQLVVLVSEYPGWQLSVDGKPASVQPVNGYLGAALLPGDHTYEFYFHPVQHDLGLGISAIAFLIAMGMIASEFSFWKRRQPVSSPA